MRRSTGQGRPARVTTGGLDITGFCWGGAHRVLYAAHSPKLKAGVASYGRVVGQASGLAQSAGAGTLWRQGPGHPARYDRADARCAAGRRESLGDCDVSGRGHGFNADYRAGYKEEEAQDGWKRLQQWFKKYGAA